MVTIAAFVVNPGLGIAFLLPLRSVGAAVALVVLDAHPKLRGGIFAQVMGQSLPVKAHPEAALQYQPFMVSDGLKMP
jgi:hypothetical protein